MRTIRFVSRRPPGHVGRLLLLGAMLFAMEAGGSITFHARMVYPTADWVTGRPRFLAVGDVNEDGHEDLVLSNYSDDSAIVLTGTGTGSFVRAGLYATGYQSHGVVLSDLDGDGHLDLAVANADYFHDVSVLLGRGDGTFETALHYPAGPEPREIAAGDLNGDGLPDLVVAVRGEPTGRVSILLNEGGGEFGDAVELAPGARRRAVALADLNGDTHVDLVETREGAEPDGLGAVAVWFGQGDGTFGPSPDLFYEEGYVPNDVAIGDLNGDGAPDMVSVDLGRSPIYGYGLSVYVNLGDGTFRVEHPEGGNQLSAVAIGDSNGDGNPDLAVTDSDEEQVSVLLGNGDATFQPPLSYAVGRGAAAVAYVDIEEDGALGLAVACPYDHSVSILPGYGDGTYWTMTTPPLAPEDAEALSVDTGDLDGDGAVDLVAVDVELDTLYVLLADEPGTFPGVDTYPTKARPNTVKIERVDGDDHPDVVVGARETWSLLTFTGNDDGTFPDPVRIPVGSEAISVVVGDLNEDGRPDLAVARYALEDSVCVLLGEEGGPFGAPDCFTIGWRPFDIEMGDLNADGHQDLVVVDASTSNVYILLGAGDGTFPSIEAVGTGSGLQSVAIGDLDGDGTLDLAVAENATDGVVVLMGVGNGSFLPPVGYAAGVDPHQVVIGDLNADGNPDLVVGNEGSEEVSLLFGNGDGSFQAPVQVPLEGKHPSLALEDLDGDGHQDMVVANAWGDVTWGRDASVLLGRGDGTFQAPVDYEVGGLILGLLLADVNEDGLPDLVAASVASDDVSVLPGNGDGTFGPPTGYWLGASPTAVAVADMGGDGHPDVAATLRYGSGLSVALGEGEGRLGAPVVSFVGAEPQEMLLEDLNGDGTTDVALLTRYGEHRELNVMLGSGVGSFLPSDNHSVSGGATSIGAGDFNRDDIPDLVVAENTGRANIFLGNGDGSFSFETWYATGYWALSVDVGDLDGDGFLDLATANRDDHSVTVLLGDGDGGFPVRNDYACGQYPDAVAMGDLDLDGDLDLAVALRGSRSVSVLWNHGPLGLSRGSYQGPRYGTEGISTAIVLDDLDGDGWLDVVAENERPVSLAFFLNTGEIGVCPDGDGDGYGDPFDPVCAFTERDCDDADAAVSPGAAENCWNETDDDCDGLSDAEDPDCASAPWALQTAAQAGARDGPAHGAAPTAGCLAMLLLPAALIRWLRRSG